MSTRATGEVGPTHQSMPQAQFLNLDGRDVQRDIFPLPSMFPSCGRVSGSFCRKVRQRLNRRTHIERAVEDCISGLNALYFGTEFSPAKSVANISAGQQHVWQHIYNSVQQMGEPDPISGTEALKQLRAFDGYGESQIPDTVKTYSPELLSLPDQGNQAIPLETLLGGDGRDIVGEFVRTRLLNADEARIARGRSGVERAYSDPRLRDPKVYRGFVKRLMGADLIEMSLDTPKEKVEVFFVGKKDGRLRMVVDCRLSNTHFRSPDKVTLCTAEALSRIEIEQGTELVVCTADLKDAFYHFSLPEELRPYFGMRSLLAGELGILEVNGVAVGPTTRVHPRLKVLPMGWSHALWWCQCIHQRIVEEAGATRDLCLEDRSTVPNGSIMHIEYVDNYIVLGTSKEEVQRLSQQGVDALRNKGLVVHEEETSEKEIKILGWEFKQNVFRPLPKRLWKVMAAIKQVLVSGSISGRQLEKIVGHAAFICLGRRESLSVFGETYTFIQRCYHRPKRVWKSVRRELQIFSSIAPLLWRDLSIPWSTEVTAIDASDWGLGATSAVFDQQEVRSLGKHSERWRFDIESFAKPRASTFGAELSLDCDEAGSIAWAACDQQVPGLKPIRIVEEKSQNDRFQLIRLKSLHKKWKVVGRYKWKRSEPIPVLEARAALHGVKHTLRNFSNFGQRHLILSDSITAVCSLDRGRGRAFKMRRVSQQVGALSLATHSSFHFRWLPSEWNPADGPSRGSKFPTKVPESWDHHGDSSSSMGGLAKTKKGGEGHEESQGACERQTAQSSADDRTGGESGNGFSGRSVPEEVHGVQQKVGSRDWFGVGAKSIFKECRSVSQDDAGSNVFGGGRSVSSTVHGGRNSISAAIPESTTIQSFANEPTMPTGVEETRPTKEPVATSVGTSLLDGRVHDEAWDGGAGSYDDVGLCGLPQAWGNQPFKGARHSTAVQCSICQPVVHSSASFRSGSSFEDSRVRRDNSHGLGIPLVPSAMHLQEARPQNKGSQRACLQEKCEPTQGRHEEGGATVSVGPPRRSTSIPSSPWRCQSRLCQQAPQSAGCAKAGAVEKSGLSSSVRKGRTAESTAPTVVRRNSQQVHHFRKKHRQNLPVPALSPSRCLAVAVFIEIFSGCGKLASAVARVTGWTVLLWDINLGDDYDLTKASNRGKIVNWIRAGLILGLHLGTPCESFSRARDVPPGPMPLRSDARPLGLDGLKPHDQVKVLIGNMFMRFSAMLLRLARFFNFPATLENPARSRLWLCPPIKSLINKKHSQFAITHYCAWGTQWKKATGFLGIHICLDRLDNARCLSSKRGICGHTGKPHVQLHGRDQFGNWLTKQAQPYPPKLCTALAKCFLDVEVSTIAMNFSDRVGLPHPSNLHCKRSA